MAEEKAEEKILRTPIRLMFGVSARCGMEGISVTGFSLVYENSDGTSGCLLIDYNSDKFRKIKFVDDGEDEIVWAAKEVTRGLIFKFTEDKYEVKEIRIKRNR
mgnify:CR=1 FL=1